jgi:flagellar capping protein FliD
MTMANGDNRLVLTAVDTGTQGFSISDDSVNGGWSILEKLGILSADNTQQAASGNALLADGLAATETTKFDEINTVLNKATIKDGDVVGIYLPTDKGDGSGGWVTFELFKDELGNKVSKTIGEVLGEINSALAGAGADITASINSCGEIVLKGNLNDDQNLGSTLKDVKLQIGTFDDVNQKFTEVKKDMGTFSSRNVFENVINEGKNAFYTLDGMSITSQSNSDDKTISGTVFTLKKVSKDGMEPIKLSLELDKDAIIGNITSFIDEFNALIKFIDENTKASVKEEKDEVTGQNRSTRTVGAFTGDTNISSLRENLRRMVTGTIDELTNKVENGYTTVYSSISRLGIITEKDGTLGVDREKLSKALTSDFEGVRRLFTSNWFSDTPGFSVGRVSKEANTGVYEIDLGSLTVNGETASGVGNILTYNGISFETPSGTGTAKVTYVRGIASMLTNFVEKARNTVDGYYKQAEKTYQDRIDNIQKRVDELQVRVDNYNKRLVSQYASLERSMSNLQSQTANMMSALSSLSYK